MNHHKISDATREKYEDAVVSVFMDQYAGVLDTGIREEINECSAAEFPAELDMRCMELIRKEYTKQKRRTQRKAFGRVCRSAAVVLVALLTVGGILFASVEAFRIPVMNFIIVQNERYAELTGRQRADDIPETFNEEDPLGGIIPPEFVLKNISGGLGEVNCSVEYINEATKASFCLSSIAANGTVQIDTEGVQTFSLTIGGHDAIMTTEENCVVIVWLDENLERIFTLSTINVSEEAAVTCAEEVAALLDN